MFLQEINNALAEILNIHGVKTTMRDNIIYANLQDNITFTTNINVEFNNDWYSSRLDIVATTDSGNEIIECFGDVGETQEFAIQNNFKNFCNSSLHVLLAAFGVNNHHLSEQVDIEEWEISDKKWQVFVGGLAPKTNNQLCNQEEALKAFFEIIQATIKSQQLNKKLHWFRSYYLQSSDKIMNSEFLIDNWPTTNSETLFLSLPLVEDVRYYSCRNFIIVKEKETAISNVKRPSFFKFFKK